MSEHDTAAAMREAFDAAFASPRVLPPQPGLALVALRLGEDRFALALDELTLLAEAPEIVPLPGSPPVLLGLAGLRGQLLPVYDLARLVGQAPDGPPAWLALVDREAPMALAFSHLDGHLEVPTSAVRPLAGGPAAAAGARALVRGDGAPLALLDLAALAERARRSTSHSQP